MNKMGKEIFYKSNLAEEADRKYEMGRVLWLGKMKDFESASGITKNEGEGSEYNILDEYNKKYNIGINNDAAMQTIRMWNRCDVAEIAKNSKSFFNGGKN